MKEIWKDVKGHEGLYKVSNKGRVKSLGIWHTQPHPKGNGEFNVFHKPKILTCGPDHYGYRQVSLGGGKKRNGKVCWLVMEAFIGPRPPKMDVCHKDGNRQNDDISNLYYGTRKENIADAIRHGTFPEGEASGQSKLTSRQVVELRNMRDRGVSFKELGKIFKVSQATAWKVSNREVYSNVT